MNTQTALKVAAKIAELTQLCTVFQARYGRRYAFTPDSPPEAQALHDAIGQKQQEIAALLDAEALQKPFRKPSEWWKWSQTMDTATAGELAQEANHLIACCAYFEADSRGMDSSYAVQASQAAIAGMLRPDLREAVAERVIETVG